MSIPNRKLPKVINCEEVFSLAKNVTFVASKRLFRALRSLNALTQNSLDRITAPRIAIYGLLKYTINVMMRNKVKILSAIGSRTSPKVDSKECFLAR